MTIPVLYSEQKLTEQQPTSILDHYLTEEELAAKLKIKRSTLQRWRRLGIGPPYTRRGKTPLYHDESAAQWLRDGEIKPRRSRRARKTLARNSIAGSPP